MGHQRRRKNGPKCEKRAGEWPWKDRTGFSWGAKLHVEATVGEGTRASPAAGVAVTASTAVCPELPVMGVLGRHRPRWPQPLLLLAPPSEVSLPSESPRRVTGTGARLGGSAAVAPPRLSLSERSGSYTSVENSIMLRGEERRCWGDWPNRGQWGGAEGHSKWERAVVPKINRERMTG